MDSNLVIQTPAGGQDFDESQVPLYYSRKTVEILHKYGPGPRVHFHMGLFVPGATPNTTVAQRVLKRRVVESQEAIVEHAARSWGRTPIPRQRPRHRLRGRRRVALLGPGARSDGHRAHRRGRSHTRDRGLCPPGRRRRPRHPLLADVHAFTADRKYDAAYANESSGYMDRERLFQVVAESLKPGGWFGIQEHFICRPEWTEFIDGYYKTRLGTLTEYLAAAEAAGFELEQDEDVTDRVAEFWVQSMAWNTAELDRVEGPGAPSHWSPERLRESAITHGKLFRIWRDHALETRLLLFRLGGGS